jgi:hypothetical protein
MVRTMYIGLLVPFLASLRLFSFFIFGLPRKVYFALGLRPSGGMAHRTSEVWEESARACLDDGGRSVVENL